MKETNAVAAADEPASGEALDETTKQVLDEYSRKFLGFIQQEKEKVRKQAQTESERIVIEAEKKAKFIYDKAVQDAKVEAQRVLQDSDELANRVFDGGLQLSTAVAELKEKTQQQIDALRNRLQHEADAMAEYIRQSDTAIEEASSKIETEFTRSSALLADLLDKFKSQVSLKEDVEKILPQPPPRPEASSPPSPPPKPVEEPEEADEPPPSPRAARQEETGRRHADKSYVGTMNFDVYKGTAALSRRFKDALSKVPGLEISMADDASKEKLKIVAFANRPLQILSILHQMSIVKSVVADQDTIEVVLQEADRWIG